MKTRDGSRRRSEVPNHAVSHHAARQGPKTTPNQVNPRYWVYDLGENGDLSVDATLSSNVRDLVTLFQELPRAKGSFATKWVNPDLLDYDPQGHTRVRMSLMPADMAKLLDIHTLPTGKRIAAIPELYRAGYEVHLNFSPVVLHEGWEAEWNALVAELDDVLPTSVKQQLAAEIIMLTHNSNLHELNLSWHPKAEELLWRPDIQEVKVSEGGGVNVRYPPVGRDAGCGGSRTGWRCACPTAACATPSDAPAWS